MNITKKVTASVLGAAMLMLTACKSQEYVPSKDVFSQAQQSSSPPASTRPESSAGGTSSTHEPTSSSSTASSTSSSSSTSSAKPVESSVPTPVDTASLVDDDDTLTILSWAAITDVNQLVTFFCDTTGYDPNKIKVINAGVSSSDARNTYRNVIEGNYDVDLMFCDTEWVGEMIESDLTVPLSELGITKAQYPAAYGYTLAVGTNSKGEFTAATWQAAPGCFVYNAQKAKELLGVNSPEQMQAKVKDWDTFFATAREVYEHSNGKTCLLASEDNLWRVRLCNMNRPWVSNGKLNTEFADEFLGMVKEYYDNHVMYGTGQWTDDWFGSVYTGSAIGEFLPTWGLTGEEYSLLYYFANGGYSSGEPANTSLLSACAGPQSFYWGGTYICAANKINTKKTASEFIRYLTQDEDAMEDYSMTYNDFMNNSNTMSRLMYKNPVLIGGQDHFEILSDSVRRIDLDGKVTMYDTQINYILNTVAVDYMQGVYASKEDALAKFKEIIRSEIRGITVE